MKLSNLSHYVRVTIFTLALFVGMNYLSAAWSDPTANPPNGNSSSPINASNEFQLKNGDLGVNNFYPTSLTNYNGSSVAALRSLPTASYLELGGDGATFNNHNDSGVIGLAVQAGEIGNNTVAGDMAIVTRDGKDFHVATRQNASVIKAPTQFIVKNSGNVGIGNTNPRTNLEVKGKISSSAALDYASYMSWYDLGVGTIGAVNSIYSYGPICSNNSHGGCIGTGGVVIDGRSLASPNIKVNGPIQIDTNGTPCDSTTGGSIRFNNGTNKVEYCDKASWTAFGTASGASLPTCAANQYLKANASGGWDCVTSITGAGTTGINIYKCPVYACDNNSNSHCDGQLTDQPTCNCRHDMTGYSPTACGYLGTMYYTP